MAAKRREERERQVIDLAEQIMVAIGARAAAVAESENRAGEALRELTEREGLSLSEALEWCGETVTVREATRLPVSPRTIVVARRAASLTARRRAMQRSRLLGVGERVPVLRLDDANLAAVTSCHPRFGCARAVPGQDFHGAGGARGGPVRLPLGS